jgi:hypothetical protein
MAFTRVSRLRSGLRITLLVGMLSVALGPWVNSTARAQTAAVPDEGDKALVLGEHTFMPNALVSEPFIRTHFRTKLGIGKALALEYPIIVIDSITIASLSGDLLFATLEFEYQHAIKKWLAIRAQMRVLGRLGTQIQSLLSQGLTASLGTEIGFVVRIVRTRTFQLSGTADLRNANATVVNISRWVEGIVDTGSPDPNRPLVSNTPILMGGLGGRMAWSITPLLGIMGELRLGLGETSELAQQTRIYYDAGAIADFDLRALKFIPVGVGLAYRQSTLPSSNSDVAKIARSVQIRIGYVGRDDYAIGLEVTTDWLPSTLTDQTIKAGTIVITTRYFF